MNKGTVKFFNDAKGFGFIKGENGEEIFVHVTGLNEDIRENDEVIYETEKVLQNGHYVFKIEFKTIYGNNGLVFAALQIITDKDDKPNNFVILVFMSLHLLVLAIVGIFLISCM